VQRGKRGSAEGFLEGAEGFSRVLVGLEIEGVSSQEEYEK
jgi:hypothetical protein